MVSSPPDSPAPSPALTTRKRAPSVSVPSLSPIKRSRSHNNTTSAASVAQDLAEAAWSTLDALKQSEAAANAQTQSSPQRHRLLAREAIQLLEADALLPPSVAMDGVALLSEKAHVANAFLAIGTKEHRALFICKQLGLSEVPHSY